MAHCCINSDAMKKKLTRSFKSNFLNHVDRLPDNALVLDSTRVIFDIGLVLGERLSGMSTSFIMLSG